MTKLEKILRCPKCNCGNHLYLQPEDCDGQLQEYISKSSLIDLLKGRIEGHEAANKGMSDFPETMNLRNANEVRINQLQSLLSMIEKGE